MQRTSRSIKVLLVALMVLSVASGIASRVRTSNLDSANFLSFMDRHTLLAPLSSDYAATNDGLIDLITSTPSKVCSIIGHANNYPRNFFHIHAYIFPTLMSLSGWLIPLPTNWIAGLWLAGSLVGGLLAIIVFLKKTKTPLLATAFVMATLIMYPVLTNAFNSQIYIDLLIFGPACGSVLLLWWMKYRSLSVWPWAVTLLVCLATVSERGAYIAGLIGLVYSVLLFGTSVVRFRETRYVTIAGLSAWVWMVIWTKFFQSNVQYQRQSIGGSIARLKSLLEEPTRPQFIIFVMTSIVLLILSLFSGRGFLVALSALAPNLLITTGGAELSGFYSHYHQTYLAVLVSTAIIGFVRISSLVKLPNQLVRQGVITALGIVMFVVSIFNWTHYGQKASMAQLKFDSKYVLLPTVLNNYANVEAGSKRLKELTDYLETLNPKTISGGESIMPALFLAGFKDVEYWPVGVGVADAVVAPMDGGTPTVYPFGDVWGNGEELRTCTMASLENQYQLVRQFENYGVYQKHSG